MGTAIITAAVLSLTYLRINTVNRRQEYVLSGVLKHSLTGRNNI